MNNKCTKFLGFVGVLLICGSSLQAQNQAEELHSFYFRGQPLGAVLETVAQQTETDLVFDPDLVRDIHVYERIEDEPVTEILKHLLSDTELDYLTLSSGTIVIVKKVSENPAFGSYYGKVVDSQNGDPLPGASVMLADASGGTSTSSSGNFTINKLISGTYTIIFSYVGYEPVYKTVQIEPNQKVRETVSLNPKRVDFVPIVVTGHLSQMPYYGENGQSIAPRNDLELNRTGDAIQSLTLFPGVQYGLPMTDLHLQGGQLGEHRILLDGVPVYNPYSFGKLFSAFSPFAIDRMELHKAGYGVSHGSQISGLINMKHDIDSDGDNSAMMELDPLSLNARADLHLPDEEGNSVLNVMAAARTNFWNIYREPSLRKTLQDWDTLDPLVTNTFLESDEDAALYEPRIHSSEVNFYDIHFASRYKIDAYRTLKSSFYAGKNFVNTDLLREAPAQEDLPRYLYALDEYRWNNFMGQVSYDHLVSSRLDIRSRISYSTNRFRHRYLLGTTDTPNINLDVGSGYLTAGAAYDRFNEGQVQSQVPTQRNTNRIQHGILETNGTYSLNPHLNLDAGLQLDFVQSEVNLSDLFYLPTESHQKSIFYSGYMDSNWQVGSYWRLSAGSRFTFANFTSKLYAEPRFSLQYDHPGSEDRGIGYWSARLSGGLYRQFINQYDITNPGPTSLVPSLAVWSHAGSSDLPKAWHLSGSFKLAPSTKTEVNLEWFYKWQPTAYTVSYDNLANGTAINRSDFQAFAETTQIKSLGGGIRIHQSANNDNLKLILGYDYSYNRINLSNQFGHHVPTPWNEPHRLQARALWRFLPQFSTVVKWQTILGRTWGFRQSYYNFLFYRQGSDFGKYDFMSPGNDDLDPFHQLDLSIIYKPSFNNVDMELRLDLVNLLDRPNTIDWSLQPQNPGNATNPDYTIRKRTMPGFSPSLTVQVGI